MIKNMHSKLQKIPSAAWIIVSVGVLIITLALAVKILTSSNVSVNTSGITIEATTETPIVELEAIKEVDPATPSTPSTEEPVDPQLQK